MDRSIILKKGSRSYPKVLYWMSRDQRVVDNWALIQAQIEAQKLASRSDHQSRFNNGQVEVVFCLQPKFLDATLPQYEFMLEGLKQVEVELKNLSIPFTILLGNPSSVIPDYVSKNKIGLLVTDFSPLKISKKWKKQLVEKLKIPFIEVDTHNIVPCHLASDKKEFAARTFRPRVMEKLQDYLDAFPKLRKQKSRKPILKTDWERICRSVNVKNVEQNFAQEPGSKEADEVLRQFISDKLPHYAEKKNDPNEEVLSNLSPYLHFGQISAQRVVIEIQKIPPEEVGQKNIDVFLEELIVRKELADNFCHYEPKYDSFEGFHEWAQRTLDEHRSDIRESIYNKNQFENAQTHDDLWNAAQLQMMRTGKMHGYMCMYWAKKILEWSVNPEDAMDVAIYLNDKYSLDGRDPNGYAGIAWAIGGVHDRAWTERPVFGKIRYMNYNGAKRKFDVAEFVQKWGLTPSKSVPI